MNYRSASTIHELVDGDGRIKDIDIAGCGLPAGIKVNGQANNPVRLPSRRLSPSHWHDTDHCHLSSVYPAENGSGAFRVPQA
ncbi:MAG TPA: hypothetical protein VHO91_00415 [Rhodopila sp.]|nr:hypothetical protein [Rhodopila sp.]